MAGLNYGYSYRRKPYWTGKQGVFFVKEINKWIVRIHKKKNTYTTISQHKAENAAKKAFELLCDGKYFINANNQLTKK